MKIKLKVWRQKDSKSKGKFVTYKVDEISEHMSFMEMLDVLNESLEVKGEDPIAFEHDCREGICGCCSLVINGHPHGPNDRTTTCQLHMRSFKDGDKIVVEPWRAHSFPILKDLIVDRSSFERIIRAGGYISVNTGCAPDAHIVPVPKRNSEKAMDAAECISCGACVAACPNGSASLFTAAKISHLGLLPQGQAERFKRVKSMVEQMDEEGFGSCTNYGECQEACPKSISIEFISRMNRDYMASQVVSTEVGSEKMKAQ